MMKYQLVIVLLLGSLLFVGCSGNKKLSENRKDRKGRLATRSFGSTTQEKLDLSKLDIKASANIDPSQCKDLSGEGFYARKAYFSGDGTQLLILGNESVKEEFPTRIKIRALDDSGLKDGTRKFRDGITSAAISHNGQFIAVATAEGEIKILDAKDQALRDYVPGVVPEEDLLVTTVAFAPEENLRTMRILTGFDDGSVIQWKIRDRELKRWSYNVKQWHENALVGATYAQDDIGILTQSDYLVKIWTTSQKEDNYFYENFHELKKGNFSPDGIKFVAHTKRDSIVLWPNKKYLTETINLADGKDIKWMSISDSYVLTVANDDVITIYDVKKGSEHLKIDQFANKSIDKVELSPNDDGIIICFRRPADPSIFYDIVNEETIMTLPVKGRLNNIHFSKDGNHFLVMDEFSRGMVGPTPKIPRVKP